MGSKASPPLEASSAERVLETGEPATPAPRVGAAPLIAAATIVSAAVRPEPVPAVLPTRGFVRGKKSPRGVVWFGLRSFWGHMQHFIASAIATEDIDSRDWMHADDPQQLCSDIAAHLSGAGDASSSASSRTTSGSLTEALERDVWIDYVADTGDDVSVSEAVAELIFRRYELPDPENDGAFLPSPRGDILFFGGDTAYPVATAAEIHDRVIVPFNKAIARARNPEGEPRRAVLAIPGNHDWYDGLDGFGRFFRRRLGDISPDIDPAFLEGDGARETKLEQVVHFVERFVVGGQVQKQKILALEGYVPFQQASYFALPLAPGIDWLAIDRQLRSVDFRQRRFFGQWRDGRFGKSLFVVLPDPVYAFLDESPTGIDMVTSLELDVQRVPHFVLAGDLHHYERQTVGESLHVTAGGGGAFLHPARVLRDGHHKKPDCEFPTAEASRALLRHVPLQVALGKSGFIPHLVIGMFFAPALHIGLTYWGTHQSVTTASFLAGLSAAVVFALIGDIRKAGRGKARKIIAMSIIAAAIMGLFPALIARGFTHFFGDLGAWEKDTRVLVGAWVTLGAATFVGAWVFGLFLATLTRFGLESTQAFTTLGHPGFKHFLRLRVRKDGTAIDGWCIGLVDPLREGEKPVLVDRFTWRPPSRKRS